MTGIHDVSLPDTVDSNEPISKKKLVKLEGRYSTQKILFGFDFDGIAKTTWLDVAKWEKLLTILESWVQSGKLARWVYLSKNMNWWSVVLKLRCAFTCIPAGVGLPSLCNRVFQAQPPYIYLN